MFPLINLEFSSHAVTPPSTLAWHPFVGAVSYEWKRLGGELPSDAMVNAALLHIRQVNTQDAGDYICVASNEGGSIEARAKLSVECESR